MLTFAESKHPVFRATSPLPRGTLKSKGGKLSIHFCADGDTIETVLQLSIYGAVSDMCDECISCHDRTGRPVVAGQSDPLFVPKSSLMKTHTLLTDDPALEEDLLRRYRERVENLPQPDQLIKICIDAGFQKTVEVGQYFMTKKTLKNSHNSQIQWPVVSTHCQETKVHLNQ